MGTGSPGYIPVENLAGAIEAGPDGDVFSFAVLMLFIFVKEELRESNMFAHSVRNNRTQQSVVFQEEEYLYVAPVFGDSSAVCCRWLTVGYI